MLRFMCELYILWTIDTEIWVVGERKYSSVGSLEPTSVYPRDLPCTRLTST